MAQHLRAVYEHGVFRPLEPVRLEEHQEVTLVLEAVEGTAGVSPERKPIWEVAADLVRDIPDDELRAVGRAHECRRRPDRRQQILPVRHSAVPEPELNLMS